LATPRKHWFRVADSIAREPWSNDVLATVVRLMAMLNTQWARNGLNGEEAVSISLSTAEMMQVTGSEDARTALRRLQKVASCLTCTLEVDAAMRGAGGKRCRFTWPKWAIFQDLRSPETPREPPEKSPETPPPQDAPARRTRKTHPQDAERTDAAVASPTAKREVKRETDPWLGTEYRLTQAQIDRLRAIRIRGFERSEADVIAWFMVKAPIMVAKGYKSLPRTALNWWPRATPEEIAEAVRAYDNRTYARHCELNPLPPYDEEAEKAKIATMLAETGWGRVVQ